MYRTGFSNIFRLPVLGELLSAGPAELAEGAVVGGLLDFDCGAPLVILYIENFDQTQSEDLTLSLMITDLIII